MTEKGCFRSLEMTVLRRRYLTGIDDLHKRVLVEHGNPQLLGFAQFATRTGTSYHVRGLLGLTLPLVLAPYSRSSSSAVVRS